MSKYKPLAEADDLTNPRWVCPCGREHPLDGPAYPVCSDCGQQARFVTADDLPYVDSRASRLESAREQHRKAYETWRRNRETLRYYVENEGGYHGDWRWALQANAEQVNWTAEEVDRLEAEGG